MIAPPLDLTMRSGRASYLADLAGVHLGWAIHFLHYEEPSAALASHARFAKVVEAIESEMAGIRDAMRRAETIGREVSEWRRDRDRRSISSNLPKTLPSKKVRQAGAPAGDAA